MDNHAVNFLSYCTLQKALIESQSCRLFFFYSHSSGSTGLQLVASREVPANPCPTLCDAVGIPAAPPLPERGAIPDTLSGLLWLPSLSSWVGFGPVLNDIFLLLLHHSHSSLCIIVVFAKLGIVHFKIIASLSDNCWFCAGCLHCLFISITGNIEQINDQSAESRAGTVHEVV